MKRKALQTFLSLFALLLLTACGNENVVPTAPAPQIKTVENEAILLTFDSWDDTGANTVSITREGMYTGEVIDGIPNGEGTFSAINDTGNSWVYTGSFVDGKFHGHGKTVWDDSAYVEEGTYTEGRFTPTKAEFFNALTPLSPVPYSISAENLSFIDENADLFPASTDVAVQEISGLINSDLTYPMMTKTLDGLEKQLYQCNYGLATQVFQESMYSHTFTTIIARDEDYNYYYIFYDGILPDVYDNTSIAFSGLPVSASGFDNVGGGITNVIVLIGTTVDTI